MKDDLMFIDRLGKNHKKPVDAPVNERYAVYGVAITNNRILMVRPTYSSLWELPGGEVRGGEREDAALADILREEAGYAILEMDKNPIATRHENLFLEDSKRTYYHSHSKIYALTNIVKLSEFEKNDKEVDEIEWVNLFSLDDNNCNPTFLKVIQEFIQQFL